VQAPQLSAAVAEAMGEVGTCGVSLLQTRPATSPGLGDTTIGPSPHLGDTLMGDEFAMPFIAPEVLLLSAMERNVTSQEEMFCPPGKDCTRSVIIDESKHWLSLYPDTKPVPGGYYGLCYNIPAYYGEECLLAGKSPIMDALVSEPKLIYNTTCEDRGYWAGDALYSDPFYGKHNNVSIFVPAEGEQSRAKVQVFKCQPCMASIRADMVAAFGTQHSPSWGDTWRAQNPECK